MLQTRLLKVAAVTLAAMMTVSFAGCQTSGSSASGGTGSSAAGGSSESPAKKTTISFFSDLPDRTSDQGLLEQTLIDNYEKANPNITVKVEALQDDPYKQKFKAYTAANNIPDLFMCWGQPSFFQSVMEQGYAAELNPDDYKSFNFFPGSLDGFSLNGKLYGLPRNSDFEVLYYNNAILQQCGIQPPKELSDLVNDVNAVKAKGYSLISIGGQEKWPLAAFYNDFIVKETGSDKVVRDSFTNKDFSDPAILKAAQDFQTFSQSGVYQPSFVTDNTGAAQNLFAQGKTAFFYSGEWDMGMATNNAFSQDFRNNLRVSSFPVISGGKGKVTDLLAWNGGGYAVAAHSQNKDEAVKLMNYILTPDNWAKQGWQQGLIFPAQTFTSYFTGKETVVQKSLASILQSATSTSGTTINDSGSAQFKTDFETAIQELAAKMITPQQFVDAINASVKK